MDRHKQKIKSFGNIMHLSEFGILNVFSQSLKILSANPKLILAIFLIVYLPLDLLPVLFPSLDQFQAYNSANAAQLGYNPKFNFEYTLYSIIKGLVALFPSIAMIYVTSRLLGNENQNPINKKAKKITLSESYTAAKNKWLALFLTSLLATVILFGLTLLLIVPGIIYYVYYAFFPQIVVLKNLDYKNALDYSKKLVKGRWWKVLGFIVMLILLSLIMGLAAEILNITYPNVSILVLLSNLLLDFYSLFVTLTVTVYFINLDQLINKK